MTEACSSYTGWSTALLAYAPVVVEPVRALHRIQDSLAACALGYIAGPVCVLRRRGMSAVTDPGSMSGAFCGARRRRPGE